jgi:hypothetical protein
MSATVITLPAAQAPVASRRRAPPAQKDPVFAAIEHHRAALWARWAALRISGGIAPTDPRENEAMARTDAACAREHEALERLITCRPTTTRGLVSLIAYLGQPEDDDDDDRPPQSETIICGATRSGLLTAHEWSRRMSEYADLLLARPMRSAVDEPGSPR